MSEAAKQAQRDYMNNWRKKNPEKVKKYNNNYWESIANKEQNKEQDTNK